MIRGFEEKERIFKNQIAHIKHKYERKKLEAESLDIRLRNFEDLQAMPEPPRVHQQLTSGSKEIKDGSSEQSQDQLQGL